MRVTKAQIGLVVGLAFVVFTGIGCEPEYDESRLSQQSNPPGEVYLTGETLDVPAGIAVLVRVDPRSSSKEPYSSDTDVELRAKDTGILNVKRGLEVRQFVLIGISPGNTCLEVVINGTVEECIDTMVGKAVY
jgi:hypothetical protein